MWVHELERKSRRAHIKSDYRRNRQSALRILIQLTIPNERRLFEG